MGLTSACRETPTLVRTDTHAYIQYPLTYRYTHLTPQILLSDTVCFIQKLTTLVPAFRATLEELEEPPP